MLNLHPPLRSGLGINDDQIALIDKILSLSCRWRKSERRYFHRLATIMQPAGYPEDSIG
jgi:hypothetical protein